MTEDWESAFERARAETGAMFERTRAEIDALRALAKAEIAAREAAAEETEHRLYAVRFAWKTAMTCRRWNGLDRKKFDAENAEAIAKSPEEGPKAVWREVLKREAMRITDEQ